MLLEVGSIVLYVTPYLSPLGRQLGSTECILGVAVAFELLCLNSINCAES